MVLEIICKMNNCLAINSETPPNTNSEMEVWQYHCGGGAFVMSKPVTASKVQCTFIGQYVSTIGQIWIRCGQTQICEVLCVVST